MSNMKIIEWNVMPEGFLKKLLATIISPKSLDILIVTTKRVNFVWNF